MLPLVIAEFSLLLCAGGYISIDHCTTHTTLAHNTNTHEGTLKCCNSATRLSLCNNTSSPGVGFFLLFYYHFFFLNFDFWSGKFKRSKFWCFLQNSIRRQQDKNANDNNYVILVKDSKHQSCKLRRIALWKELFIDPDESLH